MPPFYLLRSYVPIVRILDITINITPGDFVIHQGNRFHVVDLRVSCHFSVWHPWVNARHFHALNGHDEVALFLSCMVNAIPANLRTFQRLTGGNGFV